MAQRKLHVHAQCASAVALALAHGSIVHAFQDFVRDEEGKET